MLHEKSWLVEDKLSAIDAVTIDDAQTTFSQFLVQSSPEILVHGNLNKADAQKLQSIIIDAIQATAPEASLLNPIRAVKIPVGSFIYAPPPVPNNNAAIEVYLQVNSMDRRERVLAGLFAQIFQEPFFNVLRTQEQLGYVVSHGTELSQGVMGLRFLIQSERPPIYLDDRIETFIENHARPYLNNSMTLDDFERHKQSLITQILTKKRQLAEETESYWREIESQIRDFEHTKLDAELLRQDIGPLDLQLFASRFVWKDASERRKLAVHIWPNTAFTADAYVKYNGGQVIKDRIGFLNRCELYPGLPSSD